MAIASFGFNVLDPILKITRRVCQVGVWVGGMLMIASSLIIAAEVLLRKFFTMSFGGADEIGSYVLAVSAAWAFAFALLQRAHVRIDSLYVTLPRSFRAALDILGLSLFLFFFSLVLYYAFFVLSDTIQVGSRSWTKLQTPLVIPQGFWFAGLTLTVFTSFLLLLRALVYFITGDLQPLPGLIGSRSIDEDLDEDIEAVRQAQGQASAEHESKGRR